MRTAPDSKFLGFGKIQARESALVRVPGCCSVLTPLLKRENLNKVMDFMKFSIGTTIPKSNARLNETTDTSKNLGIYEPSDTLMRLFKNRYILYYGCKF